MNPQALSEYLAYRQQASEAADRRFALLTVLALTLAQRAKQPGMPLFAAELAMHLDAAVDADDEFIAALDRANLAAPLCGQSPLEPRAFTRPAFNAEWR